MKPSTGPTPLFALEAVALDTETTGLDPARARIVQIGAVHLSRNRPVDDSAWQRVVDPGIAIPDSSVRIHGITTAMAREAPRLGEVWTPFTRLIDRRVVIGHSIGFDLAVLAAEARRCRLAFAAPRALDVRLLAQLVAPGLADHSLEALAAWLGLTVTDRHQALGDARAAGAIFAALVPLLSERGVTTLAEAERACRRLTPEIERQQQAGWTAPTAAPGQAGAGGPLGRVDTYPYRHRVGEVMKAPVVVVTPETTLKAAMDVMIERAISSVFVNITGRPGEDISAYSILTERDVTRRIAAEGAAALVKPVSLIASRPVLTIRESAFVYRAIGRMSRLKFRHLGVRSEEGRLVGVVSARDLLKLRTGPAIALADAIDAATDADDMAIAWADLPTVADTLIAEAVDAALVCQIVSEEIRAMTRRAAVLAEAAMAADGLGAPPCPYAVLVLGSGGRGESMLVPDQDNAVVFAEGEADGAADRWFAELGARVAATLDRAGIPLCKGGVMARNAEWRGSTATWQARIGDWVRRSRPQDLLNVDIFFDMVPVHGDLGLGQALFAHAYERGSQSAAFAKLLGESLASLPNPFTLFGGLSAPGNRLDLKLHGLFPIAACARALAISHGIAERATRARLEALAARSERAGADLGRLADAHGLFMSLVLECQSRDIGAGIKPSNRVDLAALSRQRKDALKQALRDVRLIPTLVRDLMFA
ncbi:MAG: hypothetical protein BroJett024_38110 [Alphaproteobacteria bacterium]|nr:MAG: hypothetical protein BroJett024_38110 [Alphaproteobacteria bacterium]